MGRPTRQAYQLVAGIIVVRVVEGCVGKDGPGWGRRRCGKGLCGMDLRGVAAFGLTVERFV